MGLSVASEGGFLVARIFSLIRSPVAVADVVEFAVLPSLAVPGGWMTDVVGVSDTGALQLVP